MMGEDHRVVIVGAGVGGLATAEALRQRGIAATVLERRPEPVAAGFAFNLPGNAVRALAQLGLGEELARCGVRLRRREYRSERGRLLFAVDEDGFWGEAMAPRSVRRAELLRMLERRLPEETVLRGQVVRTIEPGQEAVGVTLGDGAVLQARVLVGAEGVDSAARAVVAGGEDTVREAALAAASWRFIVPAPEVGCWTAWVGRGTTLLLMPVGGGEAYGWAAAPGSVDLAALPERFRGFPAVVRRAVEAAAARPEGAVYSPIREVRTPRWSRDGVVLVGDAAHAAAPVWAQGAAMALEDAIVLAERLAEQPDRDRALAEFEMRRRPRVAHVRAMTDRMSRSAALPPWLRNAIMPVVGPRSYRTTYGMLREAF